MCPIRVKDGLPRIAPLVRLAVFRGAAARDIFLVSAHLPQSSIPVHVNAVGSPGMKRSSESLWLSVSGILTGAARNAPQTDSPAGEGVLQADPGGVFAVVREALAGTAT